jgi:hypothetical protein
MVLYAVLANFPCIITQRFNRIWVTTLLAETDSPRKNSPKQA